MAQEPDSQPMLPSKCGIVVQPSRQLVEATDVSDDWTGLKDAEQRRRIQNRLHQRKYRKIKAQRAARRYMAASSGPPIAASSAGSSGNEDSNYPVMEALVSDNQPYLQLVAVYGAKKMALRHGFQLPMENRAWFPLTRDVELLFVIAHNMARGLLANAFLIASLPRDLVFDPPICPRGGIAHRRFFIPEAFNESQKTLVSAIKLPTSLMPTAAQASMRHHPVVDLLPCPKFRDNLLRRLVDNEAQIRELVYDMIGDAFGDITPWLGRAVPADEAKVRTPRTGPFVDTRNVGIISWSDPWDVGGWEFTEMFIRKWSPLFKGCDEVLAATNKWRAIRGEEALIISTT